MKKKFGIVLGVLFLAVAANAVDYKDSFVFKQWVKIGGSAVAPASNVAFEVNSTTKVMLPPRMTTGDRDAIATPSEGSHLFNTTTHKPNWYNATSWIEGGSGGGQGGVNYLTLSSTWGAPTTGTDSSDFEGSVGTWLDNGGVHVTCDRTTSAGEVLNGAAGMIFVKDAHNHNGLSCNSKFYIPPGYRTAMQSITMLFKVVSGTYAEGDVTFAVRDMDAAAVVPIYTVQTIVGTQGKIVAYFPTPNTTSNEYRLNIDVSSTSALAYSIAFDDIKVSPNLEVSGFAATNFSVITATFGAEWGTPSDKYYTSRRVGDSLEVEGFLIPGTTTGADATIPLLTSAGAVSIDTAKYSATNLTTLIGEAQRLVTTTQQLFDIFVDTATPGSVFLGRSTVVASGKYAKIATSTYFASGDLVPFKFKVKISGWDAHVTIGANSTFKISSYLAGGTRVTGGAPTSLGQYRSYIRSGTSTFTETNGAPTTAPSTSDGVKIYGGGAYAGADTNSEPTRYEIFVGRGKHVNLEWYGTTARTGFVDTTSTLNGTAAFGYQKHYDTSTGILSLSPVYITGSETGHACGRDATFGTVTDCYFDVIVSENPQFVGMDNKNVSSNAVNEQSERARILLTAGAPSISRQSGAWLSSVTDNGVGDWTLNIVAGMFSVTPSCMCMPEVGALSCSVTPTSTTAVGVQIFDVNPSLGGPAAYDSTFNILCQGAH